MPTPMMLPMIKAVDWGSPNECSAGGRAAAGGTLCVGGLTVVIVSS
jgi:hypothetical protein